ncbi:unnamed protein product [marine sediment metagenome]|uniref:Uncharacterized protein n=1 Tax=marine sediment metagenome TaxID=412755 RepID=X1B023_9ZZZZ
MSKMSWKDKLRNVFSRGHKDIYEAVKIYSQERGVATTDVVASAVSSYLAADEEGKDILEKTMEERRKSGGGGGGQANIDAAVKMFVDMTGGMTQLFQATNELRASVSIGSMVSDFETVTGAVEKIKGIGADKGKGSIDDYVADAFVRGLIKKVTGTDVNISTKETKETGKGKVEVIEDE